MGVVREQPGPESFLGSQAPPAPTVFEPEPFHLVAGRHWIAFRSLSRLTARGALAHGRALREFLEARVHRAAGFASFHDFTREVLKVAPRTAKRRLALARLLAEAPPMQEAYLEGRLSACKALALRPVSTTDGFPFWIDLAETLQVRELETRVRRACTQNSRPGSEPWDGAPARVRFAAPRPVSLVWDQGLTTARRALGWNAPVADCVGAILAEADPAMEAADDARPPDPMDFPVRTGASPPPEVLMPRLSRRSSAVFRRREPVTNPREPLDPAGPVQYLSPEAAAEIRQTLAFVEEEIRILDAEFGELGLLEGLGDGLTPFGGLPSQGMPPAAATVESQVERYRALEGVDRRLRLLQGRLIREMWTHSLHRALGCATLAEFAEQCLGLSERAARDLVSEAFLFDDRPLLAEAFVHGRIGLTQARLVHRVALDSTLRAHLDRAQAVTLRQLEREVRFQERMAELAPEVRRRHPGPLPDPGLEEAFLAALEARGVERAAVIRELKNRGLECGGSAGAPVLGGGDPAVNPLLMTRLETLLEMLALHAHPDGVRDADPGAGYVPEESDVPDEKRSRQTLAPPDTATGWTTISFVATPELYEAWTSALRRIRAARGPLPTWACAVHLVQHALGEWLRHDPDTVPTEHPLLERDDYLCRAPGCSSRSRLEVHHIRYRSQGGPDTPDNKVTLCHVHHRHVLHEGAMRVTGKAPGNLTWELGTGTGRPPLLTFEGERLVGAHPARDRA